jgi:hypothetical protein
MTTTEGQIPMQFDQTSPSEPRKTAVIEADYYRQEEADLRADPIIQARAREVAGALPQLTHEDGGATSELMGMANDEYRRRGGTRARSIGGVARAILALSRQGTS